MTGVGLLLAGVGVVVIGGLTISPGTLVARGLGAIAGLAVLEVPGVVGTSADPSSDSDNGAVPTFPDVAVVAPGGVAVTGGAIGCCCQGVGTVPFTGGVDMAAGAVVATVVFLVPVTVGVLNLLAASLRKFGLGSSNNSGAPTAIAAASAQGIPDINEAERDRGAR